MSIRSTHKAINQKIGDKYHSVTDSRRASIFGCGPNRTVQHCHQVASCGNNIRQFKTVKTFPLVCNVPQSDAVTLSKKGNFDLV